MWNKIILTQTYQQYQTIKTSFQTKQT